MIESDISVKIGKDEKIAIKKKGMIVEAQRYRKQDLNVNKLKEELKIYLDKRNFGKVCEVFCHLPPSEVGSIGVFLWDRMNLRHVNTWETIVKDIQRKIRFMRPKDLCLSASALSKVTLIENLSPLIKNNIFNNIFKMFLNKKNKELYVDQLNIESVSIMLTAISHSNLVNATHILKLLDKKLIRIIEEGKDVHITVNIIINLFNNFVHLDYKNSALYDAFLFFIHKKTVGEGFLSFSCSLSAREVALLANSCARLKLKDEKIFNLIFLYVEENLHKLNCQDISNLTNAFSKLSCKDTKKLLLLLEKRILESCSNFSPQHLSNIIHSFAKSDLPPKNYVMDCLCKSALSQINNFKPQEVCNFINALLRLKYTPTTIGCYRFFAYIVTVDGILDKLNSLDVFTFINCFSKWRPLQSALSSKRVSYCNEEAFKFFGKHVSTYTNSKIPDGISCNTSGGINKEMTCMNGKKLFSFEDNEYFCYSDFLSDVAGCSEKISFDVTCKNGVESNFNACNISCIHENSKSKELTRLNEFPNIYLNCLENGALTISDTHTKQIDYDLTNSEKKCKMVSFFDINEIFDKLTTRAAEMIRCDQFSEKHIVFILHMYSFFPEEKNQKIFLEGTPKVNIFLQEDHFQNVSIGNLVLLLSAYVNAGYENIYGQTVNSLTNFLERLLINLKETKKNQKHTLNAFDITWTLRLIANGNLPNSNNLFNNIILFLSDHWDIVKRQPNLLFCCVQSIFLLYQKNSKQNYDVFISAKIIFFQQLDYFLNPKNRENQFKKKILALNEISLSASCILNLNNKIEDADNSCRYMEKLINESEKHFYDFCNNFDILKQQGTSLQSLDNKNKKEEFIQAIWDLQLKHDEFIKKFSAILLCIRSLLTTCANLRLQNKKIINMLIALLPVYNELLGINCIEENDNKTEVMPKKRVDIFTKEKGNIDANSFFTELLFSLLRLNYSADVQNQIFSNNVFYDNPHLTYKNFKENPYEKNASMLINFVKNQYRGNVGIENNSRPKNRKQMSFIENIAILIMYHSNIYGFKDYFYLKNFEKTKEQYLQKKLIRKNNDAKLDMEENKAESASNNEILMEMNAFVKIFRFLSISIYSLAYAFFQIQLVSVNIFPLIFYQFRKFTHIMKYANPNKYSNLDHFTNVNKELLICFSQLYTVLLFFNFFEISKIPHYLRFIQNSSFTSFSLPYSSSLLSSYVIRAQTMNFFSLLKKSDLYVFKHFLDACSVIRKERNAFFNNKFLENCIENIDEKGGSTIPLEFKDENTENHLDAKLDFNENYHIARKCVSKLNGLYNCKKYIDNVKDQDDFLYSFHKSVFIALQHTLNNSSNKVYKVENEVQIFPYVVDILVKHTF